MTDPRLLVEVPHPDGKPRPARLTWQADTVNLGYGRWAVDAFATKILGYVEPVNLDEHGQVMPRLTHAQISASPRTDPKPARKAFQAFAADGAKLDGPQATREDAAALVVGAAHSDDPMPEHVVPRNVGGRPVVGKPINLRLGDDLLARVDERAKVEGKSRADMSRELVAAGMG